jgi:alpha-1,6-mannosyltransferase
VALVPLPPALSDDLWRYLWDGRVAAAGANPYRWAPDAAPLRPLRGELWERVAHREVPTVYPPLAVAAASIAARWPRPELVWKGLVAAADLATCALLVRLAVRRGLGAWRAALYAWNPLVVLETAGMGHVDALAVLPAVGAVALLAPARPLPAAAAAPAGVLAKLAPAAALPMWARQSGRPALFLGAALVLVAACLAPVVVATGGLPPGLATYGISWEFNGPLYEPLWRGLARAGVDEMVKSALDAGKARFGAHPFWERLYPYVYPQLLARLALGVAAVAVIFWSLREREPWAGSRRLFGRLLILSPTVYPWYLLWVLPWAALTAEPVWLLASATILLSYLTRFADLAVFPWLWLLVWGPPAALLAARYAFRRWSSG